MPRLRMNNSIAFQENALKYLCLVYMEEHTIAQMDDQECMDCGDQLRRSGRLLAAEPLHPVSTATTVRVRNGKVSVMDGPFAETKEALAGFYLVDARDLNEAIQIAAKIPPARVGSIGWLTASPDGARRFQAPVRQSTTRAASASSRPLGATYVTIVV